MPKPSDRQLLMLVFTVTMTSLMGNSLLSPVIPDVLADFGRPEGDSGLVISAGSLPGIVVAPIIGILADRFGRRAILVPCLAIFGVAGIATVFAETFALFLTFRLLMGIGTAGLVNLAIVLIGDRFEGEQRSYWVGVNAGVLTLALAVVPLASGGLAELGGWRLALAPYGVGIISAFAAWHVLDGGRPARGASFAAQLSGIGIVLRRPAIFVNIVSAAVMFAIMFGVFLSALPTHLESEFGLSSGWRGVVLGLPALTSSVAAFNSRRLRQRFGTTRVMLVCAALWIVAFATMGFATTIVVLVAGTLLYGLGEGGLFPIMQNSALDEAPPEYRAVVLASWTGSARLGQTVGPLIAGVIISGYGTGWTLISGAIGSAVLFALFVTTVRPRPRP